MRSFVWYVVWLPYRRLLVNVIAMAPKRRASRRKAAPKRKAAKRRASRRRGSKKAAPKRRRRSKKA